MKYKNVALIGMPASGKTEVGKMLAPRIEYGFVDVDEAIERTHSKPLQDVLDEYGNKGFIEMEGRFIMGMSPERTVISPGGSCVYCTDGMSHLMRISYLVFLDAPEDVIVERMRKEGNIGNRGIVNLPEATENGLRGLYHERHPLYKRYADYRLEVDDEPPEQTVKRLERHLRDAEILLP